jgi:hypothetical protein
MKIEKEEIKEEDIKTEEITKEEIKKEDVESSFRASLSHFAYPSSPPSARRPPKRPSPDSIPNPPSSASLTVTVAVAQPTPRKNDGSVASEPQAVQPVQALRRSHRKRKGETRQSLDTGGGGGGTSTRPSKKVRRNPRAPEAADLSHLGALPEHLAEDLDGTFLPACCIPVYIK